MDLTVLVTVISGVLTYVFGQLVVKLVIEPVQDLKRTIGQIAYALIEDRAVIANPGFVNGELLGTVSRRLRQLASQLQSHIYLVPRYNVTATVFGLPRPASLLKAATHLIGLSNSLDRVSSIEGNAKRIESIHDLLGIYFPEGERWPKD